MIGTFLLMIGTIFLVNVIPAFMPPTWMILVFFTLRQNLPVVPVIIIGVLSAVAGRVALMFLASSFVVVLPKWMQENYKSLGELLKSYTKLTIPVVLAIAFSPLPSNQMFIVAGLSGLNKRLVAGSFLFGRIITYSFWVLSAKTVNNRLEDLFEGYFDPTKFLMAGVGVALMIWLVGAIPWSQIKFNKSK